MKILKEIHVWVCEIEYNDLEVFPSTRVAVGMTLGYYRTRGYDL